MKIILTMQDVVNILSNLDIDSIESKIKSDKWEYWTVTRKDGIFELVKPIPKEGKKEK